MKSKEKKESANVGDWFSPYIYMAEDELSKLIKAKSGDIKQRLSSLLAELGSKYETDGNKDDFKALNELVDTLPDDSQIALSICISKDSLSDYDNRQLVTSLLGTMLAMSGCSTGKSKKAK